MRQTPKVTKRAKIIEWAALIVGMVIGGLWIAQIGPFDQSKQPPIDVSDR